MPTPRPVWSRRELLVRAGLASLAVPALGSLGACTRQPQGSTPGATQLTIAAPDNPVTWPISPGNEPIADGLRPETGAKLRLYNYADYISPGSLRAFEERYDVDVSVSTFNTADEALAKVRSGGIPFDVYFPSYDQISKLVSANLIRPLNHSYLPHIEDVWPEFTDPWYDGEWRYTVPYTIYTTGIGWRADLVGEDVVARDNPYDVFWDEQYANNLAVIDDFHTTMGVVLLRNGITDLNTGDPDDLALVRTELLELTDTTKPKVTVSMYSELPGSQYGLSEMWSGDAVNAQYYLGQGVSADTLRFWFPDDGKGMVDNDLMVVLAGGQNPVLSHLFLDHMLEENNAIANFGWTGYQPPQRSIDADRLVEEKYIPPNLIDAAVRPEYFGAGYRLLELPPDVDAAWHEVWQEYKAGA